MNYYLYFYIIERRGEKNEYKIGFTADSEMQPERCDSVLALIKKTFYRLSEDIDKTTFNNARESLLKSLDELEKTKNGFWLDIIWRKEDKNLDWYTNRRRIIKRLTPSMIQKFMKDFLKHAHYTETLMQPK